MVAVAFKYLNMTPGQHVLLPMKSSDRKWESYQDDMKIFIHL